MYKKLLLVGALSLTLGGCTIQNLMSGTASRDEQPAQVEESVDYGTDQDFVESQKTSVDDTLTALEEDISSTEILDEDLSDL